MLKNFLFLLGGYDLEMVEIQKLLAAHNVPFLDAKLGWDNAIWEAYRQEPYLSQIHQALEEDKQVFGIELRGESIEGCGLIDHHNELQHLPSAIEQVASLLGLELDRRQLLVAANDKGYIPAMKEMGASQDEIDEIRRADRKVQGVTEEEEKQADIDISNAEVRHELWVIYTCLSRFSPIPDKLFGKTSKLLIYSDSSLNFYGIGKNLVAGHFREFITNGKAYEGGGDAGYFGISKSALPKDDILKVKNKIVSLTSHLT
ncbi:MAG: hypothetical protein JJU34_12050 [Lunatimonas sp.]|uniref:hypothetical protein n=1 Tax=Lunatimonas sp. TaxID=2060141 RepID=UPI00263A874E|nr:hypothetical protein [Lunatimonas sp.]MCC5938004.1 hypothetical protein [Lunatimonas sp.]